MKLLQLVTASTYLLPGALAWGSFGHITVAYLATALVSPKTEIYFQALRRNNTHDYLAGIATWADGVRRGYYGFTETFHFIDAHDAPPHDCNVNMERDCKATGCVVTAIANYTTRLLDLQLAPQERDIALRFLVHFVGDIHQPLHNEDVKRGGTRLDIKFDGTKQTLHKVWDSSILNTWKGPIRKEYLQSQEWAVSLAKEIKQGKFKSESGDWAKAVSLQDSVAMALEWSNQGNDYICTNVLPQGAEAIENEEIGKTTKYYEAAVEVIEVQIARAGFRLAALLDKIAAANTAAVGIDEL